MIYKTLTLAIVAAALVVCGNVNANENDGYGATVECTDTKPTESASKNCGRGITQQQAAALWAGYCNENCDYEGDGDSCGGCRGCGSRTCGGGCGLLKRRCKKRGAFGSKSCGCEAPCCEVAAPADCGCGDACGAGCGCGGKLRGMFRGFGSKSGGCGCGCDSGCFGYPTDCCGCDTGCGCGSGGGCGGGGGCFAGLRAKRASRKACGGGCGCGCGKLRGMFNRSKSQCGCNGAYFDECVGQEYGNCGMQSCVAGCAAAATEPMAVEQAMPETDTPDDAGAAGEIVEDNGN